MKILTLSSVFPNPQQPLMGLFVLERIRHVAKKAEVRVLAPVPWSPFDSIARLARPGYRLAKPGIENRKGLQVSHPRFLCMPGFAKIFDGYFYARSVESTVRRIRKDFDFDLIDAHFAYPDGVAAALLASRLGVPFVVTLRGSELPYSRSWGRRKQMRWVFRRASTIIAVSASLASLATQLGAEESKVCVISNGIDNDRFRPLDRSACRQELMLQENGPVILSVGGLVERKGFHRVIELLPRLRAQYPDLVYLIVGGASVEGDFSLNLREQVNALGLSSAVRFEGSIPPEELPKYYSAADVFVLASSNEGWANVLVESLASGTPVVATDVGGNSEVLSNSDQGIIVPFGDPDALLRALSDALSMEWRRDHILSFSRARTWDTVASQVLEVFGDVCSF